MDELKTKYGKYLSKFITIGFGKHNFNTIQQMALDMAEYGGVFKNTLDAEDLKTNF